MTAEYNKRNKCEWIEGAAALFDCSDDALLTQEEVARKLDAYLRPALAASVMAPEPAPTERKPKRTKEETVNVDSTE